MLNHAEQIASPKFVAQVAGRVFASVLHEQKTKKKTKKKNI